MWRSKEIETMEPLSPRLSMNALTTPVKERIIRMPSKPYKRPFSTDHAASFSTGQGPSLYQKERWAASNASLKAKLAAANAAWRTEMAAANHQAESTFTLVKE
jgi:hypothetical protein